MELMQLGTNVLFMTTLFKLLLTAVHIDKITALLTAAELNIQSQINN